MAIFSLLQFLLNIGIGFVNLFSRLGTPTFDFSWADEVVDSLDIVLYLIPLAKLEPLMILIVFIVNFKIIMAFINALARIIPFY